MAELNPEHPVTKEVHDHWHKIAALMLHKQKLDKVIITAEDILTLPADTVIACHVKGDELHIYLVTEAEARRLMNMDREGGAHV